PRDGVRDRLIFSRHGWDLPWFRLGHSFPPWRFKSLACAAGSSHARAPGCSETTGAPARTPLSGAPVSFRPWRNGAFAVPFFALGPASLAGHHQLAALRGARGAGLEGQFLLAALLADHDGQRVLAREPAAQQVLGHRVFQVLLDRATQRPGAVLLVAALLDQ